MSNIAQLKTLNDIMRQQFITYPIRTVAILGIAVGNGLSHVDTNKIDTVYGIDINHEYLSACKNRYSNLKDCLKLIQCDLSSTSSTIPNVNLVIINLLIEYIGIETFIWHMQKSKPENISCVIQHNENDVFVSF